MSLWIRLICLSSTSIKLHQTDPTNMTLSSSTTYSYSAPITAPLTTTPTLCPVLPPCSHLFSYPNYSLPPTADTTNPLINAMEFTSPHPCVNDYLVYPPTNYYMTHNVKLKCSTFWYLTLLVNLTTKNFNSNHFLTY